MLDITEKEMKPIVYLLAFTMIFLIVIAVIKYNGTKQKEDNYLKHKKDWRDKFLQKGIYSISVITKKPYIDIYNRGDYICEVDRIYINNKISIPDSLFHKEYFFLKHCNRWYFLFNPRSDQKGGDSIVIKFSKYDYKFRTENYDKYGRFVNKSIVTINKGLLLRNKHKLPKCWD